MTLRKPLITKSGCSQTHSLGKVRGTKVMEAFGLSNVYYVLSLSRANKVMVGDQNHHPQTHPSERNLLGDQTRRIAGPADSHRDVLSPCLYSVICYGLSNGPSTFLDCHGVSGKVGQFSNPCTYSCE